MSSWEKFWSEDPKLFGIVMQKSTDYFANQIISRKIIDQQNQVLDFGCGPGYLAESLVQQVNGYVGVDISPVYIDACKERFKAYPHFRFSLLHQNEKTLGLREAGLPENNFDTIIILSVVQYFDTPKRVAELLESCKPLLTKNGKIILADTIASDHFLIKDVFSILLNSIRRNYFFSFMKFLYRAKFSVYNELRKEKQLLCLGEADIDAMTKSIGLCYSIIPGCTLQASRITYCITLQ